MGTGIGWGFGQDETASGFHAARDLYHAGRDVHIYIGDSARRVMAAPSGADTGCPYPDLSAFDEKAARWFFGREKLTAQLLSQLNGCLTEGLPLMVVAPSGAGKSSLLRAGLLHQVASGGLTPAGSRHWPQVVFTPGAHPFSAAAAELLKCPGVPEGSCAASAPGPEDLDRLLDRAVAAVPAGHEPPARAVIVVDQFEELFRLCGSDRERSAFISWLCRIASADSAGGPRALVACGLRADFYPECLMYSQLHQALQSRQAVVGEMSEEELRRAITCPARAVGLDIDDGLVELLLTDLRGGRAGAAAESADPAADYNAGRLPLLAHALAVTWQQRHGNRLTVAGYKTAGRIEGAIARTAEQVFSSLDGHGQQEARALFVRLVKIGESSDQDVRQPVSQFDPVVSKQAAGAMLDGFIAERLLTPARDGIQITHEAMLGAWPTLKGWLDKERAGGLLAQEIKAAAANWLRASRDSSHLYRGARLENALTWAASHHAGLTGPASNFLETSRRHDRRARIARRGAVAALAMLTATAVTAAAFATVQQRTANEQRQAAAAQALLAQTDELRTSQVGESLLLGIAAMKVSPGEQARSTLIQTLIGSHSPTTLPGDGSEPRAVAFGPAGHLLFTGYSRAGYLWDLTRRAHPKQLATLHANSGGVWAAAFSPDGRLLATVSADGHTMLWDVAGVDRLLADLPGDGTWVTSAAFSPDGRRLLTGTWDNSPGGRSAAYLWDVSAPGRPRLLARLWHAGTGPVRGVAFSHDGTIAYTANDDGTVGIWNVTSPASDPVPAAMLHAHRNTVYAVAVSPDGRTMLTGSADQTAVLWALSDPARPVRLATLAGHRDGVRAVAFSPDGKTAVTGSLDSTAILWQVADRSHPIRLDTLAGDTQMLWGVAFSPDGRTVVTSSSDGSVIAWDVTDHAQPVRMSSLPGQAHGAPALAYSPDGRVLASAGPGPDAVLWDPSTPRSPRRLGTLTAPSGISTFAYRPDGQVIVTGSDDGTVMLWEVAAPASPKLLTSASFGSQISSLAFTRDGNTLAIGVDRGTVALVDVADPAEPHPFSTFAGLSYAVSMTAFTPDGRSLIVGSTGASLQIWDVVDREHPHRLFGTTLSNSVYSGEFSPDGHTLAVAEDGRKTTLWDLSNPTSPEHLATMLGQASSVFTASYSPDGRLLATGGFDKTVILWDPSDPRRPRKLLQIPGFPLAIGATVFSPDGKTLAISGADAPTLWDISDLHRIVAQPVKAACAITGHGFSPAQWDAYGIAFPYQPTC